MALAEYWKSYPPASVALRTIGNLLARWAGAEGDLWKDESAVMELSSGEDILAVMGMNTRELKRG